MVTERNMKIIVEDKIPFIRNVLEPAGEVVYLPADRIDRQALTGADALFTRTRTRCDASLLEGIGLSFIATATIGTDHIDLDYCRRNGIAVSNAPGCNAPAVAQYVMAAVLARYPDTYHELTIGVVGVGNVGRIVARWAEGLGMNVLLCDPPRACAEGGSGFVSLDRIAASADVITFHTPLTGSGRFPTYHLAGEEFFRRVCRRPMIVNAARGGVVDSSSLLRAIEDGRVSDAVIDCWEGEPDISADLLRSAFIATPHIAGYSREGKIRATAMAVEAFCRHFGVNVNPLAVPVPGQAPDTVTPYEIRSTYDILEDSRRLKAAEGLNLPSEFETMRNTYALRSEPHGCKH